MQQMKVPWLTKKSIADASTGVIAGYEVKIKHRVQPPIPVENIIELYNVKSAFCGPVYFDPCVDTWPKIAGVVKEAGGFSNVSKQRNGPTDSLPLAFLKSYTRFENLAHDEY
jgi:hypothetical protein